MAIGKSLSQITLEDFKGGVNYAPDITAVAKDESPNAMNVEFWSDRVSKRKGFEPITTAVSTSNKTGYSIVDFGVAGIGHKQIAHFGNKVYAMTTLNGTLSEIRASAPESRSYNAKVKSSLIQTYNSFANPYYWDGVSASMTLLSASAPGFKRAIEFQGYLLAMSTSANRMRVYYEDVGTMIGGTYANYFTLTPAPNDDEIAEPFLLNGRCYVGSKYSIFRVSFVGGVTVFDYKQAVTGIGIVPNSLQICVTKEFGQVAIFLGTDRQMYVFDGANVKVISEKFFYPNRDTDIALQLLDEAYKDNAYSTFDPVRQVYRCVVTRAGEQENRYMINLNVQSFAYYPYDNMAFHSMCQCFDNIGRQFLIGADYNGRLHKLFTNVNTDDGMAIIDVLDFPVLTYKEHTVTKGGTLAMYFTPAGNQNLEIWQRQNFDMHWEQKTPNLPMHNARDRFLGVNGQLGKLLLGSEATVAVLGYSISSTFNTMQFRITSGGEAGDVCSYYAGTVTGVMGGTTITGTNTAWLPVMTAANGWKIWVNHSDQRNYVYDFTYTSATTADVSTILGTADFTDVEYIVYNTKNPACYLGWELLKTNFDATTLMSGHTDVQR